MILTYLKNQLCTSSLCDTKFVNIYKNRDGDNENQDFARIGGQRFSIGFNGDGGIRSIVTSAQQCAAGGIARVG